MSYTKLDAGLTDSTIWQAPDTTRIVWITMLSMADQNGYIGASVPGLASRARVPIEACVAAIELLLAPDQWSRTQDHEGRRIAVADGGWVLLNHAKYRAKQSADDRRERSRVAMAELRARRKAAENGEPSLPSVGSALPKLIQAEAEAEATPEKESAQSVPRPNARALEDEGKPAISPAGAACLAMRKAGMAATNPGDPRLLELIRQGATVEEFASAAADAVKAEKGFAWALKAVEGRRADAAKIALAPAAPPPPWPSVWSEVVRRGAAVGMPWSEITPDGRAASRDRYRSAVVAAWGQQKGASA